MDMVGVSVALSIIIPFVLAGVSYGVISNRVNGHSKSIDKIESHCSSKHSIVDANIDKLDASIHDLRELVIDRTARIETAIGMNKRDMNHPS